MKRYMLFHGSDFYPAGGMEDFKKDSDDINDLMPFIDEIKYCEWAHIYDTHTRKIIIIAEAIGKPHFLSTISNSHWSVEYDDNWIGYRGVYAWKVNDGMD